MFFLVFLFLPLLSLFGLHIFFNYLPFSHYLVCYNKNIYYCNMVLLHSFTSVSPHFPNTLGLVFMPSPLQRFSCSLYFSFKFSFLHYLLFVFFSFVLLFLDALKSFSFIFIHFFSLLH